MPRIISQPPAESFEAPVTSVDGRTGAVTLGDLYAPTAAGVPTGGIAGQVLTKDSGTDYDTSWQPVPTPAEPRGFAVPAYGTSTYIPVVPSAPGSGASQISNSNSRLWPVCFPKAGTINSIIVDVTVAVASSSVRFGIWTLSTSTHTPDQLMTQFVVSTATTGVKTTAVSMAVPTAGWYYVSWRLDSATTNPQLRATGNPTTPVNGMTGAGTATGYVMTTTTETPSPPATYPSTWNSGTTGYTTAELPISLMVRYA